jgi:pSer/pThr/pTyr-binding forkhead associated (FHA) protein
MWILATDQSVAEPLLFRLSAGSIKTIGRSTGAEFQVEAPLVSRLHCQLTATDVDIQIKDLDSTNGTFVNGSRVSSARAHQGDTLRIGRVELRISRTD